MNNHTITNNASDPSVRLPKTKSNTNQQREFSSDVFLPFITPNCACCSVLPAAQATALASASPRHRYHHQKTQSLPIAHYHPNTIQLYPNNTSNITSQYPIVPIKPQPMMTSGHHLRRLSSRVMVASTAGAQMMGTTASVEPSALPLNTFGTYGSPIWSPVLNGSVHVHDSGHNGQKAAVGDADDVDDGDDDDACAIAPDLPLSRPPSRLRAAAFYNATSNGIGAAEAVLDHELAALSNMTITSTTTEC